MTENTLADRLEAVRAELARRGCHLDPVDWTAPDIVLAARLTDEERRLRAVTEATP